MSFLLNFASDKSFHLCPALNCHLLPCCGGHLNVACSGSSCLHLCSFFFFFLLGPFWVTCPFCIVLPGLNVGVLAIVYHLCPRAGAGSLTAAVLGQWGPTVLNPLAPKQADTCNCGAGGVVYDKPVL